MRLQYLAAVLTAALLAGCAVVDVTKTGKGFYDKTNANEVEILKTRPERSYDELGTVTATGFAPAETAKMHNAIRTKSAALGANAVILTEEGIIPDSWGGGRKWATGVAIHYK
jgi:hypothetical protein